MDIGRAVLAFVLFIVVILALALAVYAAIRSQRRKALAFGYPSLGAYLRAAPRTDEERRESVDLALKGLVICAVGLLFPPLLLIGLWPLFHGARKTLYATMGLGLVDDAGKPGA